MKKVTIINAGQDYRRMFIERGLDVTEKIEEADFVQFTGGSDVTPSLYNKLAHPKTYNNPERDRREQKIFKWCLNNGKPMAGICRGGQFLNVMCGGKMWQHIDNHAITGTHPAYDVVTGEVFNVTSTHHQMIRPSEEGQVILHGGNLASHYETVGNHGRVVSVFSREKDVEAVWYRAQKVFCFQPHPEFYGHHDLGDRYVQYLEHYLFSLN